MIFTYLKRSSINHCQKDAFFDTEDKNVLAILIGTIDEDGHWKPVKAVLNVRRKSNSKKHNHFPKVILLAFRIDLDRHDYINHDTAMKTVTFRTEFEAFKKPSTLSAVIRQQFFRHGAPLSHDLVVSRSKYTSDLICAAKLYGEHTIKNLTTVKQESSESHFSSPLPDLSPLGQTEAQMRTLDSRSNQTGTVEGIKSHQGKKKSTEMTRKTNLRSSISAHIETMSVEHFATLMESPFQKLRSPGSPRPLFILI